MGQNTSLFCLENIENHEVTVTKIPLYGFVFPELNMRLFFRAVCRTFCSKTVACLYIYVTLRNGTVRQGWLSFLSNVELISLGLCFPLESQKSKGSQQTEPSYWKSYVTRIALYSTAEFPFWIAQLCPYEVIQTRDWSLLLRRGGEWLSLKTAPTIIVETNACRSNVVCLSLVIIVCIH